MPDYRSQEKCARQRLVNSVATNLRSYVLSKVKALKSPQSLIGPNLNMTRLHNRPTLCLGRGVTLFLGLLSKACFTKIDAKIIILITFCMMTRSSANVLCIGL
jgi:hypothetical protein